MESKEQAGKEFDKVILIPTDFSDKCDTAVFQGLQLAEKFGYKAVILHVVDRKNEAIMNHASGGQECIGLHFHRYRNETGRNFRVEIETLVRKGNIVSGILSAAKELNAGMLIFATDGRRGLEYLFGSYALKLVLHSPCPVIVVQNRNFAEGFMNIVLPVKDDVEPRQAVDRVVKMSRLFRSTVHLFLSREPDPQVRARIRVISNQIAVMCLNPVTVGNPQVEWLD